MCLAIIAVAAHPRYALVVAANRDEHHDRPTAAAQWRPEGWLGGRDLRAHGTWFGVDRRGRFAFVTNVREPSRNDPAAPSRGAIPLAVLADARPVAQAMADIADVSRNGYNLVAGGPGGAWWSSNRAPAVVRLAPGVSGVSNALLDTPWPKLVRTQQRVADWCASGDTAFAPLFAALADRTRPADSALPDTGVSRDWERLLAAPFIVSAGYGTRSSTVLAITHAGHADFIEQGFSAAGEPTQRMQVQFQVALATA